MKHLCVFLCLFFVNHIAQAGTTLSAEQEATYKKSLNQPAVKIIREYIDDCLANEPKIGYPCKLTADSEEGRSLQEQGIDKIRGRFMVLRVAPFDAEGDLTVRGDLVMVIFDTPPHWMFTVSIVYQGEDRNPIVWGFYSVEMTAEKREQLADSLSVYLKDESFTR
jgi:hypothetical protein